MVGLAISAALTKVNVSVSELYHSDDPWFVWMVQQVVEGVVEKHEEAKG